MRCEHLRTLGESNESNTGLGKKSGEHCRKHLAQCLLSHEAYEKHRSVGHCFREADTCEIPTTLRLACRIVFEHKDYSFSRSLLKELLTDCLFPLGGKAVDGNHIVHHLVEGSVCMCHLEVANLISL